MRLRDRRRFREPAALARDVRSAVPVEAVAFVQSLVGGIGRIAELAKLRRRLQRHAEDVGELRVPVLPGVEADLLDPRRGERSRERARLDELRTVTDDGQDLHHADVTMAADSARLCRGR